MGNNSRRFTDKTRSFFNQKMNFSYCHSMPERSFFWKGKKFPVCARCTGIHFGFLSFVLFLFNFIQINFFLSLALFLPTYIDGLTQAFLNIESTNLRRVITGILSGIGTASLVSIIGNYIGLQIIYLIY